MLSKNILLKVRWNVDLFIYLIKYIFERLRKFLNDIDFLFKKICIWDFFVYLWFWNNFLNLILNVY